MLPNCLFHLRLNGFLVPKPQEFLHLLAVVALAFLEALALLDMYGLPFFIQHHEHRVAEAAGIAKDVMLDNEAYVLPVQGMTRQDELSDYFFQMLSREPALRQHLSAFIPDYIGQLNDLHFL